MGTKFDWLEKNKCLFNVGICEKVKGHRLTVQKFGKAVDSQDDVWGTLNTLAHKKVELKILNYLGNDEKHTQISSRNSGT